MDTKLFDHTILKADATREMVERVCREAREHHFMSVCVNSYYTGFVADELQGSDVRVCTVVGFPLGQMSTKAKVAETRIAVEKVRACRLAMEAKADFVKTSTGFSTGGATKEDVALMRKTVGDTMGVKASGGIRDKEKAVEMLEAGADRLGTSATITICS